MQEDEKVFVSDRETVLKLLNHFGDTDTLWQHLEKNNYLKWRESNLSDTQNMVLSTFPQNETVNLQDMRLAFETKYPDMTLCLSGHFRVVDSLCRLGYVSKIRRGRYKRIESAEDIVTALKSPS